MATPPNVDCVSGRLSTRQGKSEDSELLHKSWIRQARLSEYLDISERQVARLVKGKVFVGFRLGGAVLYDIRAIDRAVRRYRIALHADGKTKRGRTTPHHAGDESALGERSSNTPIPCSATENNSR